MHRRNTDSVRLRRAIPSDIPQMCSLERQAQFAAHWTSAQYDVLFESEAADRVTLVAADETNEAAVHGFLIARCLSEEWEIENVVVDADRRRQGIANSLVRLLAGTARSAGVGGIILEVRESNTPAVRLYESIGFTEDGRRKGYYRNPVEDALLYRLTLQLCDKIG
jgi:ribosomal-protein-alanine acetyltransferase